MRTFDPVTPFLGSAALSAGQVSAYQLRAEYRRVFPNVYIHSAGEISAGKLVQAASLWAPAGSVVGGLSAALLHGERWYAPHRVHEAIDIYCVGTSPATRGVRMRRISRELPPGHVLEQHGLRLTTAARTAIDVGRWENDDDIAIAKIDAVCNRSKTPVGSLDSTLEQMRGLHGVKRVRSLLRLCDDRADSPPETRLRLLLPRAGLPTPTPQLTIYNEFGSKIATADLGYEKQKVAIFYDSGLHREKSQWEYDAWANAQLAELGWERFRVTAQMMRTPVTLIRQIASALTRAA